MTAVATSNGATGSTNAMHDSFSALGVMVPLTNMLLGEVVFGGLGSGLYGLVMIALIAAFLGGLMIGRTPSYLGKRITPPEARITIIYALLAGLAGLGTNDGAHAFTEALYAYASSTANNGQAMAGLSANTPFWNTTTALAMLIGRFALAAAALALAGRFAAQGREPTSAGTLPNRSSSGSW